MDTISEKDTQSADDKKKEKISYIEAIPEWQALRREHRSQLLAHKLFCVHYKLHSLWINRTPKNNPCTYEVTNQ